MRNMFANAPECVLLCYAIHNNLVLVNVSVSLLLLRFACLRVYAVQSLISRVNKVIPSTRVSLWKEC